jgi:hypothetical protein
MSLNFNTAENILHIFLFRYFDVLRRCHQTLFPNHSIICKVLLLSLFHSFCKWKSHILLYITWICISVGNNGLCCTVWEIIIIAGRHLGYDTLSPMFLYTSSLWFSKFFNETVQDVVLFLTYFVIYVTSHDLSRKVLAAGNHDKCMIFTHSLSHLCWIFGTMQNADLCSLLFLSSGVNWLIQIRN